MNPERRLIVLLAMLAEQSGEQVSETRLEFTAKKLAALGAAEAAVALERLMESSRRFPTIAEVKAEMGIAEPSARDEAMMLADVIIAAVARYGAAPHVQAATAVEKAVGPAAWAVVGKQGGWNAIVERAGENLGVLRAQLRDVAEAYLRTGQVERSQIPSSLPSLSAALDAVRDAPALEGARAEDRRVALEADAQQLRRERDRLLLRQKAERARQGDTEEDEQ